jgi:hypothetical protein
MAFKNTPMMVFSTSGNASQLGMEGGRLRQIKIYYSVDCLIQ